MSNTGFQGVADTMFIPLAARAAASRRFPDYFYDEKALEFEDMEQVRKINEKSSEYTMLASVSRYYNTDQMIRVFLSENKGASVVNLGAGLETVNWRLKDCGGHFYQIDFPSVIESRKQIIGKSENETLIACDITNSVWTEQIEKSRGALLVASGVFQYFKPEAVAKFIQDMKAAFPHSQLIFDATNETGVKYAQRYVRKTGNQSAMMYFYINDAVSFCQQLKLELMESRGFYQAARKELKGLTLYTRIAMKVADEKNRAMLLHVKL